MSETETAALPAIRRPNGLVYRPKKIAVELIEEDGAQAGFGVLVLGTHDVPRAQAWADAIAVHNFGGDCKAVRPVAGWWRKSIRNYEALWVDDQATGRAGVRFDVADAGEAETEGER